MPSSRWRKSSQVGEFTAYGRLIASQARRVKYRSGFRRTPGDPLAAGSTNSITQSHGHFVHNYQAVYTERYEHQ
jgi:hypothetical protein